MKIIKIYDDGIVRYCFSPPPPHPNSIVIIVVLFRNIVAEHLSGEEVRVRMILIPQQQYTGWIRSPRCIAQ